MSILQDELASVSQSRSPSILISFLSIRVGSYFIEVLLKENHFVCANQKDNDESDGHRQSQRDILHYLG